MKESLINYKQELDDYEKQLSIYNSPENQSLEKMDRNDATQEELRELV